MELNITENLEKSVLLPLYTQEHELNSDQFKLADKMGMDTSKFYFGNNQPTIPGSNIPFYTEVELKAKQKSLEMTKEFFLENIPQFFANLPEDAIYGIFKGIENGVNATTDAFPGIKPFIDEVAEKNIAPEPFNLTLKQLSDRVHKLDAERDKTFANNLAGYMFQAAPYLFLARSRILQGGIGVQKANLLAWMFASGMGFKSEELLVSDIYSKALSDSKFLSSLKEFDEKISDTGVSVEGMLNFTARAADGLLFEKLFSKVREVYKNWKISKLPPKEKVKYLGQQKEIKKISEGMVEQQDKPLKFFPDQDDINTATKVVKGLDNPTDEVIDNIKKDQNVQKIINEQKTGEMNSTAGKFNDLEFQANRKFNFDGQEIVGFDNAVSTYYGSGAAKKDKIVHIMIGSPASGKSAKGDAIATHFGSKVIDSDDFKKALTGEGNQSATSAVHEEGKFLADKTLQMAMDNGDNLVVPIVGKTEDKVMSYVNNFNKNGYTVKLVYAKEPTNISRIKNIKRSLVTGRLIPDEYFNQDLDNKIQFVYDVVKPETSGSATIKTGTVRKNAIVEKETTGGGVFKTTQ